MSLVDALVLARGRESYLPTVNEAFYAQQYTVSQPSESPVFATSSLLASLSGWYSVSGDSCIVQIYRNALTLFVLGWLPQPPDSGP